MCFFLFRYLLDTGDYADASLVFTAEGADYHRPDSGSSEYGFRPKLELPCHKAILSARSPFFRNLIARRIRNTVDPTGTGDPATERMPHVPTRIVLDETVIPKRYARVLLNAIYLDTVDLTLILRGNGSGSSAGSLGEVQALTHTGRTRPTPLEEAMELYQIGRFLELNILSQGCEDLILEWLTLDTLPQVLKWGQQPHGSAWVHRQACHFLREEFSSIVSSPVLHLLDKQQLIGALQSNFLQASELEVLQAVLKWGETELMRRMEDREPNLLSHTAHSVTRKGIKKRDLSDVELREILSELLPLVRMDHVLPPNSDHLNQAIRRGLVSTPPSHMIGDERDNLRINAWVRCGKMNGLFVRPRLFMPYYEEIKTLLEDRVHQTDVSSRHHRRSRHMADIPDTLYMVSRLGTSSGSGTEDRDCGDGEQRGGGAGGVEAGNITTGLDVVAGSMPAPEPAEMRAMAKREQKLRSSVCCQRALGLPLSARGEINRQIRLRVVREFNFPDDVADLLENVSFYCLDDESGEPNQGGDNGMYGQGCDGSRSSQYGSNCPLDNTDLGEIQAMEDDSSPPPSPAIPSGRQQTHGSAFNYGQNLTFPRQQQLPLMGSHGSMASAGRLTARLDYSSGNLCEAANGGFFENPSGMPAFLDTTQSHLSQMMPDVAMATASLEQLQLHNHMGGGGGGGMEASGSNELDHIERDRDRRRRRRPLESLQLDLGDGSPHVMIQHNRQLANMHTLPPV